MALRDKKPRGRNGGRPRKLNEEQRRELGAYAYRLKRGRPFPGYRLPDFRDDDGMWPISKAAKAISHAREQLLLDRDNGVSNPKHIRAAAEAVREHGGRLRKSDLRDILQPAEPGSTLAAKRERDRKEGVERHLPPNRHWVREAIAWANERYKPITVEADFVRRAENEYRLWCEQWDRLANDDID